MVQLVNKYLSASFILLQLNLPLWIHLVNIAASENTEFQEYSSEDTCEDRSSCSMSAKHRMAAGEAFWGLFVADSMAMPVHWFYNVADIKTSYGGWIKTYTAPNPKHPSSILKLSAIDGSGRKGWHNESKALIGNVILHDKKKYWEGGSSSTHYHQGMNAGDNTLNALTALQSAKVMKTLDEDHKLNLDELRAAVMENYVKFMTTPDSHNDTYAESFHRLFFREWIDLDNPPKTGQEILKFCEERFSAVTPNTEDSQIPSVGALVLSIPWILHYCHLSRDECARRTVEAVKCTHPAPSLLPYIEAYAGLLHAVINGADLKEAAAKTLELDILGGIPKRKAVETFIQEAQRLPAQSDARLKFYQTTSFSLGPACYIKGAMSTMLFLAMEFHDDFENGIITNANCGGENAHRGAALGALLAANSVNKGHSIPQNLKDGLNGSKRDIAKTVEVFAKL